MSSFSNESEWKQGLSSSVITKIDDPEIQNEKLKKEKNQKQNQIDNLQQALDKKERKIEDEGKRNQSLQKEVECLGRTCETLQEKLTKHGLESNSLPLGNNSQINSAPTSLEKENHLLLVENIKPDSTVENDHKERIILKTAEDESVKSAKDLEEKLKKVASELDCQRENFETSKIRLEEKVKEKQKEEMEDTTRFQAELSTLGKR
ncbi:UNVERIFIED_CONTAM: hypothetical protein RMT77_018647 [Armadillidium vulgare]